MANHSWSFPQYLVKELFDGLRGVQHNLQIGTMPNRKHVPVFLGKLLEPEVRFLLGVPWRTSDRVAWRAWGLFTSSMITITLEDIAIAYNLTQICIVANAEIDL